MKPRRRVFALGGACSTFLGRGHPDWLSRDRVDAGEGRNPSLDAHLADAVLAALGVSGIRADAVERAWVGNFLGELFCRQGHLGAKLAGVHPGLSGKPIGRVEAACASGGLAVTAGVESIQAGWDVVLVAGVEIETHVPSRDGVRYLSCAADRAQANAIDFNTFPYLFARRARAYKSQHGLTAEDIAGVVAKAYDNASLNPQAQMRAVSVDAKEVLTAGRRNREFLEDPELRQHLRLLESTTFTDGAAALVLVSEEGLAKVGRALHGAVELVSWGHAVADLAGTVVLGRMTTTERAASEAYRDGGLGPGDLGVAEVHDCFAISELLAYEALGLASPGGGPALFRGGHTQRGGRIPVNPGGGLLGTGHPVGATGVRQVVDIWRQLTQVAGAYQVKPAAHGMAANMGGDDRTAVVSIWRAV